MKKKKKTKKESEIKEHDFLTDLMGQKLSVLIDHFQNEKKILKESYVGRFIGQTKIGDNEFIVLELNFDGRRKLEQIWINKNHIISIWVYNENHP